MPSALALAHIEAQARLRRLLRNALAGVWAGIGYYDDARLPRWTAQAVPIVRGAQVLAVHLTDAFLARELGRAPLGVSPASVIDELRGGLPGEEVYARPFGEVWGALAQERPPEEAIASGLSRAQSTADMDVQMAMRGTAQKVQVAGGIYGYRRVPDAGACEFCLAVAGAFVHDADAMPLHNRCGCGVEPILSPPRAEEALPSGEVTTSDYAVREHGELGPVLQAPGDHFKGEPAAYATR